MKYGPAMVMAALGAIDPVLAGIGFGMVAGWIALAAVLYDDDRPLPEIRKKLIVSLGVGGVGALFAMWAVRTANADPLAASMMAAAIAFGGVRFTKKAMGLTSEAMLWLLDAALNGAVKARAQEKERTVDVLMADHNVYPLDDKPPPDAVAPKDDDND